MTRRTAFTALVTLAAGAAGAAPAQAQTDAPSSFNCRGSALHLSLGGNDRLEPVVANGNPNTGGGASADFSRCGDADVGAGSTATQAGIPATVLSARTLNARTAIDPDGGQSVDQTASASAVVEDLRLPLSSGTVVVGAAAAISEARALCAAGVPQLAGSSQLTGLTLGGQSASLDQVVSAITTALEPLGPIVEVTVNEQVRDATSLTVRALHVRVLREAGGSPVADLVVAESKVVAPAGVCIRRSVDGSSTGNSEVRPCPPGSTLRTQDGLCVIVVGSGSPGSASSIVVGRPFQSPSGGRVLSLAEARRDPRFRNSPCVKAKGSPRFVVVGTNRSDRITGTNARDRILGLGGSDSVSGGRGDDCLDGGSGRDALNGGSSADRLSGGSGNDSINAAYGADRVFGGTGADAINVATAGRKARVSCGDGRDKVRFNNEERRGISRNCEVQYRFADTARR
jgi:hypothetical protein